MTTTITIELTDEQVAALSEYGRTHSHPSSTLKRRDSRYPLSSSLLELALTLYDPDEELIKDLLQAYYAPERAPEMGTWDRNKAGMKAVLERVRERDGRG